MIKNRDGNSGWAVNLIISVFISMPIALNLWKLIAMNYTIMELLPHIFLDVSVTALFLFLLAARPLEKPLIYWPLFLLFCSAFIIQNWPASIVEWLADILVLGFFGIYVFPVFVTKVTPYVLLGLFISYFLVLRLMLFNMNHAEVLEVMDKKSPRDTGAEFIHTLAGYERNMIGREKYRWFLLMDQDFGNRLDKAAGLHSQIFPMLKSQKISYLEWGKATVRVHGDALEISSTSLPGKSTEKGAADLAIPCTAAVEPFQIRVIRLDDDTWRVVDLPEKIVVRRVTPEFSDRDSP